MDVVTRPSRWYNVFNGLGGLSNGSFFRVNDSIDTSKPPGVRAAVSNNQPTNKKQQHLGSDTNTTLLSKTMRKIFTGLAFCYSPNLTWFIMSICAYCLFPYDLEGMVVVASNDDNTSTSALMPLKLVRNVAFDRLWINFGLGFSYITFWHVALYFFNVCDRPFVPNRVYNTKKVFHNLFYTVLGILQWTMVEGGFLYLYKTNKLPYATILSSSDDNTTTITTALRVIAILLQTIFFGIAIPAYRDVHFYFVHRFIHVRPLYKYIHSIHHRNTDTEPFAGLSMHPVEHMYYYTCYGPLIAIPLVCSVPLHPFLLFWIGMHCVISPAAAHSGYEDHFSANLEHYLHHRYCECNYSAGINFDAYFGTHRSTLKDYTTVQTKTIGTNIDNVDIAANVSLPPPPADRKSSLVGEDGFLTLPEYPLYQLGTYLMIFGSYFAHRYASYNIDDYHSMSKVSLIAFLVPFGPAVWAFLLSVWTAPKSMSWRKICLSPFDKDSYPSLFLHLGLGVGLGVLPVSCFLYLLLI